MSLARIRETYKVPARRGCSIQFLDDARYWGDDLRGQSGRIMSSRGDDTLRVRLDDGRIIRYLHPTYGIEYK